MPVDGSMTVRRHSGTVNLLLLAASATLSLVVAEIFLRVIQPRNPKGTTYGKAITKNHDGFRDREFLIPKPPNTNRILVLGDSFTWGVGLDVQDSIPKVLERELTKSFPDRIFEVVNAAIPAYNTVQELRLLEKRGLKYEPDIVVLVYNLNDIDYKPEVTADSSREDLAALPGVPGLFNNSDKDEHLKGFRRAVLRMQKGSYLVDFLVSRGAPILRRAGLLKSAEISWVEKYFDGFTDENPGWIESSNSLRRMAEITRQRNIGMLVSIYPLLVDLDRYGGKKAHARVRELCEEIGVQCIDLLEIFENTHERSYWINWVDSHPNGEAHRMVARRICRALEESLRRKM